VKKIDHGIVVIIIYVDGLIITRNSDANIFDLKKLLKQKFGIKDLGKLRYFFGIEVIQSSDMVTIKVICLQQIVQIWDDGL
jgi:hypothetical protein